MDSRSSKYCGGNAKCSCRNWSRVPQVNGYPYCLPDNNIEKEYIVEDRPKIPWVVRLIVYCHPVLRLSVVQSCS